ncbi:MAG TPA: hypothetical protein VGA55_03450 [Bacteroidota bacterium]
MQQEIIALDAPSPVNSVITTDTAQSCGVRATNYTDDGYPVKMKMCVIRSNTLSQMATLTRDIVHDPFFKGIRER